MRGEKRRDGSFPRLHNEGKGRRVNTSDINESKIIPRNGVTYNPGNQKRHS